jgi:CubicO group peptidase (beta-lactamase class C family)
MELMTETNVPIGMRILPVLAAWLLPATLICSAAEKGKPSAIHRLDGSTIAAADAEAFARKTLEAAHVTGAEIAVLNHGHLVWSRAFGFRRLDPQLPMDRDTTTWAASITKSVFATYVMQLVERGEFQLDVPVAKQLPRPLDTYDAYRESASDLVHDPQWPTVTPRMLLSHTSGLLNFAFIEPDKKMHLHSKPGTRFSYSGEGIDLVQFLVEQQKGRLLDQLMQDALFTPLGMIRTGIIYRDEFAANVADRYDENGKFRSQTKRFPARAAGSMTTSAEDLSRFVSALFAGKILNAASRKEMFKPYIQLHSLHEFPHGLNEPESTEGPSGRLGLWHGLGAADENPLWPGILQGGPRRRRAELHDLLRTSAVLHDPAHQQRQRRTGLPLAARNHFGRHGHSMGVGRLHGRQGFALIRCGWKSGVRSRE